MYLNDMIGKKEIISGLFLLMIYIVNAQEPLELVTDRPDITESATVMPHKFLQIETGFLYKNSGNADFMTKQTDYNTTLMRYGLLQNLEVRLGIDYSRIKNESSGQKITLNNSFSPLLLGVKVGITEEKGLLPKIALLGQLYLPFTVKKAYRPETTGVDLVFALEHSVNTLSSISFNIGAAWQDDSPEAYYLYSVSYGYSITQNLGAFFEVYGNFPENSTAEHFGDLGLTYKIRQNLQVDALVGTGLGNEQNFIVGGGLTYRMPY